MISLNCPSPLDYEQIVMAHGGGGRLMQQLLNKTVQTHFSNSILSQQHDSAILSFKTEKLAFTSDSYVIKPLFFEGGDIGKLAVCGTLNDLAMSGAKPLYLSCSLILEEGFAIENLNRILHSMQKTAAQAGALIVTGDTKVVENGKGDGIYINTSGIGVIHENCEISPFSISQGDCIIVSSDLARHGMSIMLTREGLNFEHTIESDCADVSGLVQNLLNQNIKIHCMRDLTRGGLASCLIELAKTSQHFFSIEEVNLPIRVDVQSVCDILGFDPLYVANEGCFVLFVPESEKQRCLALLQQHPFGQKAVCIGQVIDKHQRGLVTLKTLTGTERTLDLLSGEQLPRIC